MLAIDTKNLEKTYGQHKVVKGLNLQVDEGEIFGFLGRNGAGKSTLINMLTGIIRPASGSFSLLGVPCPNGHIKKMIGVMPDYSVFYGNLTVLEHLKFLSALSGKPAAKERCLDVLQWVGLDDVARKKASKLSFGMKKKLGIAQAIIHDPKLIFLDEPTSGMDAESAIHIHRLIKELHKSGKTIFMTSHNLDEVEKLCTRIAIMKDGEIAKIGTMEELRSYYRSTITVHIKHGSIPEKEMPSFEQWLGSFAVKPKSDGTYTTFLLKNEKEIAELLRTFYQYKIDVYRVGVEEPTLEDIFLEEHYSNDLTENI